MECSAETQITVCLSGAFLTLTVQDFDELISSHTAFSWTKTESCVRRHQMFVQQSINQHPLKLFFNKAMKNEKSHESNKFLCPWQLVAVNQNYF